MRNWNIADVRREEAQAEFVAYLWGIETTIIDGVRIVSQWFVAYLWGIKTGFHVRLEKNVRIGL